MKKIHALTILILIVAASQAISADNQVILNRQGQAKIADTYTIGVDLTKTVTCLPDPDMIELYSLTNPLSIPIRVVLWSDIASEFFFDAGLL